MHARGSPSGYAFNTPFVVNGDPAAPTRVAFQGGNGLYVSLDQADTICQESASDPNDFFGGPSIAYGIPGNSDIIYFGFEDDILVRNAAGGAFTVTDIDAGTTNFVRAIVIDPTPAAAATPDTAYAITSTNVYRTTNTGASWTIITDDLMTTHSPGFLRSIVYVESADGDGVVVGAERGVYLVKANQGFSGWESLGTGLPNAPVWRLHYDDADDMLTAGTMGRGSFQLTPVMTLVPVELQSFEID